MYRNCKDKRGFTATELVVVMAIISVLTAFAIPHFIGMQPTMRVNSASRDLTSEMQLAKMKAVSQRNNYVITFDTTNNQYKIYDDNDNDFATAGAESGELKKTVDIDSSYTGIQFGYVSGQTGTGGSTISTSVTFSGTPPSVTFYPDGTANKLGSVYMIPTQDISTSKTISQRAITVLLTGRVRLYKYNGSSWN
ncbi:MAG: GspH/FimT family pseudopilin [Thermodesulfobacteriota bacterium]|nr:GspH/FimT family pseudopilin [Thermodesulfobacteriota bacterium]